MDVFKARAKGLSDGLDPELSVVVDVHLYARAGFAAASAFFSDNSSVSDGVVTTADNKYPRIP
jgi:hypothetical protein